MKKFVVGTILGAAMGAIGYKLYKENEEQVKDFLEEHLYEDDIDIEDMDVEELEELKEHLEDMLNAKYPKYCEIDETEESQDKYSDINDDLYDDGDDDYIFIDSISEPEKKEVIRDEYLESAESKESK